MSGARDVARAIDALRRGWPVAVDDLLFLAVETADAEGLAAFDGDGPADLLISGNRAATLKLTNQREAVPTEPVLIGAQPVDRPRRRDRDRRSGARPRDSAQGAVPDRAALRAADGARRRCGSPGWPGCCRPCSLSRGGEAEAQVALE